MLHVLFLQVSPQLAKQLAQSTTCDRPGTSSRTTPKKRKGVIKPKKRTGHSWAKPVRLPVHVGQLNDTQPEGRKKINCGGSHFEVDSELCDDVFSSEEDSCSGKESSQTGTKKDHVSCVNVGDALLPVPTPLPMGETHSSNKSSRIEPPMTVTEIHTGSCINVGDTLRAPTQLPMGETCLSNKNSMIEPPTRVTEIEIGSSPQRNADIEDLSTMLESTTISKTPQQNFTKNKDEDFSYSSRNDDAVSYESCLAPNLSTKPGDVTLFFPTKASTPLLHKRVHFQTEEPSKMVRRPRLDNSIGPLQLHVCYDDSKALAITPILHKRIQEESDVGLRKHEQNDTEGPTQLCYYSEVVPEISDSATHWQQRTHTNLNISEDENVECLIQDYHVQMKQEDTAPLHTAEQDECENPTIHDPFHISHTFLDDDYSITNPSYLVGQPSTLNTSNTSYGKEMDTSTTQIMDSPLNSSRRSFGTEMDSSLPCSATVLAPETPPELWQRCLYHHGCTSSKPQFVRESFHS